MYSTTCKAPVNIALIKYWGKRNEELILPINDSLSMTLSTDEMCSKTTIAASDSFKENRMWLNGEEVPFEGNPRIMRCLRAIQILAVGSKLRFPITWKLHIVSQNNFPTAAGLASSASGYACLVYTLARLYGISPTEDLTAIARQGSGSACRSLHGGFVRWKKGSLKDGSDSIALPVAAADHWPNMHVLILVVNDERKKTGSTKGMERTVHTSELIKYRAEHVVPKRIEQLIEAIKMHNFTDFAELTMRDSNQFHAIALDAYPPLVYMNDVSHAIADFVHSYNKWEGTVRVAYTFDAGPNACLYVLREHVAALLSAIQISFPNDAAQSIEYVQGIPVPKCKGDKHESNIKIHTKNLLKYIIHTKIGEGPQQIEDKDLQSLIGLDGLPIVH